ncbi:MAG TPA: hypothetical protein ENH80_02040, partial [Phycisphaerae bacterium]|nr:hypothetical protein [Phycisphaerae bacterium]HDZ42698.1 hypothetical protein [Phycisphaerae bacterium]
FYYDSNGSAEDGTPQPRLKTRSDLGAATDLTTFVDTDFTENVEAMGSGNRRVRYLLSWTEPALGPWVVRISTGITELVVEERAPGSRFGSPKSGTWIRPERGDRIVARGVPYGNVGQQYIETARYEYDGGGRVSKVTHATGSFTRVEYDDVGRVLRTTLATAETVSDDVITAINSIAETVNIYDGYGNIIKQAVYRRDDDVDYPTDYDDFLCTNITTIPSLDAHAQVSYVYTWYDEAGRVTDVVNYGVTTATPTDDPTSTTVPGYHVSDRIITSYAYYPTGQVDEVQTLVATDTTVDTKYYYDDLGRTEYIVENEDDFVAPTTGIGGDDGEPHVDRVTKFEYNGHSQLTKQTALLTANSQTTRYVYARELTDKGTPKSGGTNIIFRNDLLRAIYYPDTDDTFANPMTGTDHVVLTYYVNGALRTRTNQNLTVHTYVYDDIVRLTEDDVTTPGTGVDGFVRSIGYTYNTNSGRLEKITSYDRVDPTTDSHVRNEIELAYDLVGSVTSSEQSHAAATSTGTFPTVTYTYDTTTTGYRLTNGARLTQVTYPTNSRVVAFDYGTADEDNDMLSRVEEIENSAGTTVHAQYAYMGSGTIVKVAHPAITNGLDLTYGTAAANYPGFDRFGRAVDQTWQDTQGTPVVKDRFEYTYDVRSNRLTRDVMPIDGADDTLDGHDNQYTYDDLARLTAADRGTLEASTFSGLNRGEDWGLTELGNWKDYEVDANGNGTINEAGDLDQVRSHNKVNEIDNDDNDANTPSTGTITEVGGQTAWATPGYNKAGNMDVMPIPADEANTYALTYDAWNRLVKVVAGAATVTEYRYDGQHRRIATLELIDGEPDTWNRSDFYYDTAWRVVEQRRQTGVAIANKENPVTYVYAQYVWDLRYIDALILRDRDSDSDEQHTLDETLYYCNDANMNVTALINASGTVVERYEYTPYGQVSFMDGSFGSRASSSYDNRILYAGYRFDSETGLYHVRHRYHHPTLGRWITRDPIGYPDGMNLYEYVSSGPVDGLDPMGLFWKQLRKVLRKYLGLDRHQLSVKLYKRGEVIPKLRIGKSIRELGRLTHLNLSRHRHVVLSPAYYWAALRTSLVGKGKAAAGVGAAGAGAAAITYLAYKNIQIRLQNRATENLQQVYTDSAYRLDKYWQKKMDAFAAKFIKELQLPDCCDDKKVGACNRLLRLSLHRAANRVAQDFHEADAMQIAPRKAEGMVQFLINYKRYKGFELHKKCLAGACSKKKADGGEGNPQQEGVPINENTTLR